MFSLPEVQGQQPCCRSLQRWVRTNFICICRGLGALVAEKFAAEGSNIAINYVSNADRAKETAAKIESQYKVKVVVLQGVRSRCFSLHLPSILFSFFPFRRYYRKQVKLIAAWICLWYIQDAGIQDDCVRVVKSTIELLGGLDVIISNAVSSYLTSMHASIQSDIATSKLSSRSDFPRLSLVFCLSCWLLTTTRVGPDSRTSVICMHCQRMNGTRWDWFSLLLPVHPYRQAMDLCLSLSSFFY